MPGGVGTDPLAGSAGRARSAVALGELLDDAVDDDGAVFDDAFDVDDLDGLPERPARRAADASSAPDMALDPVAPAHPTPLESIGSLHGAVSADAPELAPIAEPRPHRASAPPSNIREALGRAGVRGVDPDVGDAPRAPSARWTGERLPGFTRDMLDALAATDDLPDEESEDPWHDEPWDDDPWGQTELVRSPDAPSRPVPVDDGPAPPASAAPLADPPGHPVIGLTEVLETPDGRVQLQTFDRAPAEPRVSQAVYRDGVLIARHEAAYAHLLGGEPQAIARHVEAAHEDARRALLDGGLSRLGWARPAPRAAGWGHR